MNSVNICQSITAPKFFQPQEKLNKKQKQKMLPDFFSPIILNLPERLIFITASEPEKEFTQSELAAIISTSPKTENNMRTLKYATNQIYGKVIDAIKQDQNKAKYQYIGQPLDFMVAIDAFKADNYKEFLEHYPNPNTFSSNIDIGREPVTGDFDNKISEIERSLDSKWEVAMFAKAKSAIISKEYRHAINDCIKMLKYNSLNNEAMLILCLAHKQNKNTTLSINTYNGYKAKNSSNNYGTVCYKDYIEKAQRLLGL